MKKLTEIALILLMGNVLLTTNGFLPSANVSNGSLALLKNVAHFPDIHQATCEICKSGKTNQLIVLTKH